MMNTRSPGAMTTRLLQEQYAREGRLSQPWGPNPVLSPRREAAISPTRRSASPRSPNSLGSPQLSGSSYSASSAGSQKVINGMTFRDSVSPSRRPFNHLSPTERQNYYKTFVARPTGMPKVIEE